MIPLEQNRSDGSSSSSLSRACRGPASPAGRKGKLAWALGPNRVFGPAWAAKVCLVQLLSLLVDDDDALRVLLSLLESEKPELELPNLVTKGLVLFDLSWICDRCADC